MYFNITYNFWLYLSGPILSMSLHYSRRHTTKSMIWKTSTYTQRSCCQLRNINIFPRGLQNDTCINNNYSIQTKVWWHLCKTTLAITFMYSYCLQCELIRICLCHCQKRIRNGRNHPHRNVTYIFIRFKICFRFPIERERESAILWLLRLLK